MTDTVFWLLFGFSDPLKNMILYCVCSVKFLSEIIRDTTWSQMGKVIKI